MGNRRMAVAKFNYYGCQMGTRLEMILVRYLTCYQVTAADEVPVNITQDQWAPYYDSQSGLIAARYKQHNMFNPLGLHVYVACFDESQQTWKYLTGTGAYGSGKTAMPYTDYETPIYLSNLSTLSH